MHNEICCSVYTFFDCLGNDVGHLISLKGKYCMRCSTEKYTKQYGIFHLMYVGHVAITIKWKENNYTFTTDTFLKKLICLIWLRTVSLKLNIFFFYCEFQRALVTQTKHCGRSNSWGWESFTFMGWREGGNVSYETVWCYVTQERCITDNSVALNIQL